MLYNPYIKISSKKFSNKLTKEIIFRKGCGQGFLNRIEKFSKIKIPKNYQTEQISSQFQEILYVEKGGGHILQGNKKTEINPGYAMLIRPVTSYRLLTSNNSLEILAITEESVQLKPEEIIIRDTQKIPFDREKYHWCHRVQTIFNYEKDNLSKVHFVSLVYVDAKKMPEPHVHLKGDDEVWYSLEEKTFMALHDNLIEQKPGTSILIPDDGKTEHTSINTGDKIAKFFFFLSHIKLRDK